MASCSVSYTPTVAGHQLLTGLYSGDAVHASSSGTFILNARSMPPGQQTFLTFRGFDLDDFDNGVGQVQVLINGQLVVDIPAGLNNLGGTGDFTPYTGTRVNFGPFDITGLLVQGRNTILFTDPTPFDHFGIVSSVKIAQGDTVLLSVLGGRGIYPGHSAVFTFSSQPLAITSFTVSAQTPTVDQSVTFVATGTGGTAPFTCLFSFGDGEHALVAGSGATCSAVHDYDFSGTFNARVVVMGASTSDLQVARLTVTAS